MISDKSFSITRSTIPNETNLKEGAKISWTTVIDRKIVKLKGEVVNFPKNHRKIGFVAVGSTPEIEGIKFREVLYSNDGTIKFL